MYEDGYYSHMVIEEFPEGVCMDGWTKEWWYRWSGSSKKGKYEPIEKPKELEKIVAFGMS